jgi:hypothetical protein
MVCLVSPARKAHLRTVPRPVQAALHQARTGRERPSEDGPPRQGYPVQEVREWPASALPGTAEVALSQPASLRVAELRYQVACKPAWPRSKSVCAGPFGPALKRQYHTRFGLCNLRLLGPCETPLPDIPVRSRVVRHPRSRPALALLSSTLPESGPLCKWRFRSACAVPWWRQAEPCTTCTAGVKPRRSEPVCAWRAGGLGRARAGRAAGGPLTPFCTGCVMHEAREGSA